MKKTLFTIATLILIAATLPTHKATAGDRAINGLLIGGGSGAIIGQSIGRNVEATIIGATLGGVLGAVIGSDLERSGNRHRPTVVQEVYHRPPPPPYYREHRGHAGRGYHQPPPPPYYREHWGHAGRGHHQPPQQICREVVTYKEGRHRTKKIITTVCRERRPDRYSWQRPVRGDRFYR